jgi:hypothetical protein
VLRQIIFCCLFAPGLFAQHLFAQHLFAQQKTVAPVPSDFQISGVVVDSATGQPLSNTRVAIATVLERNAFTTIVTAEDGRFLFPGLISGKYTLTAQRRGYLAQTLNQHEQYSTSIAVGPDLDSSNLVFRLTANSAISGTVTDEEGDAVREAQVMLFQSSIINGVRNTRPRTAMLTGDDGSYRFSHLPAGQYFIAVSAHPWYAQGPPAPPMRVIQDREGNRQLVLTGEEPPPDPLDVAYPVTFYAGATESAGATPIVLGKGETASIDVNLHPVPALHFRINAGPPIPEGQSNAAASFQEMIFGGTPIQVHANSTQTAPGVLAVGGIAPGHYSMTIDTYSNGVQALQEKNVDVSRNGEPDGSSTNSLVSISGMVRAELPAAIPSQGVIYLRDKNSVRFFGERISDKGEVEFKQGVPPGSYEVSLQSALGIFTKSISAVGASVTGHTLQIKSGGPVKLNLVVAQGQGEVSGIALRDGKGVAGAMVILVPEDPVNNQVLFRRDQSDSDGTFTLAIVVPGRYTVLAIENGWDLEWANTDALKKFMAQGEPVTVAPKGKYSVKVKVQ